MRYSKDVSKNIITIIFYPFSSNSKDSRPESSKQKLCAKSYWNTEKSLKFSYKGLKKSCENQQPRYV